MNLTEYIAALQKLLAQHGDLPVETQGPMGHREPARPPQLAHRQVMMGRETKQRFCWSDDKPERKGDPVIRV